MLLRRSLFVATPLAAPHAALAHVGHVGEVAGHAHWIGLAAAGAAVVIGAWLAGAKGAKTDDAESEAEAEDAAGEKA